MENILHLQSNPLATILLVGLITIISFYFGKLMKYVHLPLIIGYMLIGVILGPSIFNFINSGIQNNLAFITDIALGFVALSIGLELRISSLKKLGIGILYIILLESFGAFILVFGGIFLLTGNLPMALIFAAVAPASAPAGTVAVIQEFKAKGNLTRALYAVVGFDDGLGIIIFGFAAAFARSILAHQSGTASENFLLLIFNPLKEIFFSVAFGIMVGMLLSILARRLKNATDIFIIIFGFVLISVGFCEVARLSPILTNMVVGAIVVNTQSRNLVRKMSERLPHIMPLIFILFFTLAGSSLHISALPSLGLLGLIYVFTRSAGLIGGSRLGGIIGKVENKIKKYLGLGILSQAGVAIGLALIVKHEFRGLGKVVDIVNGIEITSGDQLGTIVITTVTATCIFFELIGPILTKYGLKKAGEIREED
ncbi:MAG: cation:proton antiporter [Candidatus Cloacimonadota bacterium]|nr:cation:proton antiporter [Candidatus Cloacimonadota bacterium]